MQCFLLCQYRCSELMLFIDFLTYLCIYIFSPSIYVHSSHPQARCASEDLSLIEAGDLISHNFPEGVHRHQNKYTPTKNREWLIRWDRQKREERGTGKKRRGRQGRQLHEPPNFHPPTHAPRDTLYINIRKYLSFLHQTYKTGQLLSKTESFSLFIKLLRRFLFVPFF